MAFVGCRAGRQFEGRAQALARRGEVAEHRVHARGLDQRLADRGVIAMLARQAFGLGKPVERLGILAELACRPPPAA